MSHILQDDPSRFVMLPVKYPDLHKRYEQQLSCFWNSKEIDLENDDVGFNNLNEAEQNFLLQILGFFAASDGLVVENIMLNFQSEVMESSARAFYAIQNAIEVIHGETYALLIEKFAPDEEQRNELFQAIENHASTKAKAQWALERMKRNSDEDKLTDFSKRLIAFACVEGIMFSSSFCAIFFLKNRGDELPGLFLSNQFISRDEGLHRDFAVDLYKHFPKLPRGDVESIIRSAVEVEQEFVREILPDKKIRGMNSQLMCTYVEYVANNLMRALGYSNIYPDSKLPPAFNFMQMISLEGKTNFFEKRVSEYSLAGVGQSTESNTFSLDSSF